MHRTFDEKRNILRMEEYEDGVQYKCTDYTYDSEGRLLSTESTYPVKEYWESTSLRNTYDAAGNLVKEENETVLVDGTAFSSRTETAYDGQGRKTIQEVYSNDVLQYTYHFAYEGNTMTRTSTVPGEENSGKLVYTYDDYGNALSIEAYGPEGGLQFRELYACIGTDGSISSGIPE